MKASRTGRSPSQRTPTRTPVLRSPLLRQPRPEIPEFDALVLGSRGTASFRFLWKALRSPVGHERFPRILSLDPADLGTIEVPKPHHAAAYGALLSKYLVEHGRRTNGNSSVTFAEIWQRGRLRMDAIQRRASRFLRDWEKKGVLTSVVGSAEFLPPARDGIHRLLLKGADGKPLSREDGSPYIVRAQNVVLGTGSRSRPYGLQGIDTSGSAAAEISIGTSETFLAAQDHPKRIVFIGGGVISMELASALRQVESEGREITILQRGPRVLEMVDHEAVDWCTRRMMQQRNGDPTKVQIFTNSSIRKLHRDTGGPTEVHIEETLPDGKKTSQVILADEIISLIGRTPNHEGFGLENLGLTPAVLKERGGIWVDDRFQLLDDLERVVPGVFCIGDLPIQRRRTMRDVTFRYPKLRELIRWWLPIPPAWFEILDERLKRKHEVVTYETQPLRMKLIATANAQAEAVFGWLARGQEPDYREDHLDQKIFTNDRIAFFGPQNDRLDPSKVFEVKVYFSQSEAMQVLDETAQGFLKIYFSRTTGEIVSAVSVGPPVAHRLISLLNLAKRAGIVAGEAGELTFSGPSDFEVIETALREADEIFQSIRDQNGNGQSP